MSYIGDFNPSAVIYGRFTTVGITGAPTTLAGTPALSVYKTNSTTQTTTGVSLSVDHDSVTGLHLFTVDTSADGTFYAAGCDFQVVITTGTVGGTSVVGYVVSEFSIENRNIKANVTQFGGSNGTFSSGRPETNTTHIAGSIVDNTSPQIGANLVAIHGDSGASQNAEKYFDGTGFGDILVRTTISSLSSQTSFVLTAGATQDDAYNNRLVIIEDNGASTSKCVASISDYTGPSKTVTLAADPGIFTMAAGDIVTILAVRSGTELASISSLATAAELAKVPKSDSNVTWNPTALASINAEADMALSEYGALKPTTAGRTLDVTATGAAGVDWGNVENATTTVDLSGTTISTSQAVASVSGAVGSVTGAVGSVTGNVGGNVAGSVGSVTGNVGGNVTGSIGSLATQAKADVKAEADTALSDYGALKPTTSGRTLDVTATGAAGIDWGNVENPTTTLDLSSTTISISQAVASVSGAVGSVTGAVGSVTGNVGGNVVGSVASVTNRVTANVDQLGGVAQSLTDLKDFADTGYDPATHKVQGVVLVDTTTTNSDMRGTDNAALAVTALSTATWTNGRASNLDNLNATVSSRLASTDYTAPPTANQNATAILAAGDIDGFSLEETLKLCLAALAGKLSGAATTTIVIRSADDSANRISATVDADGNRTALTLNVAG